MAKSLSPTPGAAGLPSTAAPAAPASSYVQVQQQPAGEAADMQVSQGAGEQPQHVPFPAPSPAVPPAPVKLGRPTAAQESSRVPVETIMVQRPAEPGIRNPPCCGIPMVPKGFKMITESRAVAQCSHCGRKLSLEMRPVAQGGGYASARVLRGGVIMSKAEADAQRAQEEGG